MQPQTDLSQMDAWHDYRVESRREILSLLRALSDKGQLITMAVPAMKDTCVTSILEVDADNDIVYLDRPIDREQGRRMVAADKVAFDTALDKIRIMFASSTLNDCEHNERPAMCIELPDGVIRLQRRELFRMATPVVNPVRCALPLPEDLGEGTVYFPLADISGGGVALLDEKTMLDNTPGRVYKSCRIDIPDIGQVNCSLEVRNSQDMKLLNGKTNRRLGCQFMDMPRSAQAVVERYITKLQRELNARS
jgi:c-di-GMP-binding flagellar brake protein YcgR